MSFDHVTVTVPTGKLDDVAKFLLSSLAHLDFKEILRPVPTFVGMGNDKPWFWLSAIDEGEVDAKALAKLNNRTHVAFSAKDHEQVRQFHAAALKAGGICNGPPGLRVDYHPSYYGAFVRDPVCGINWEVVNHHPEGCE